MKIRRERKMKLKWAVLLTVLVCALAAPAESADKIRIGMIKFESKAEGVEDRQAEIITDIFTNVLYNSKNISVMERAEIEEVGRELKLNMSGLVSRETAVQIGKIKGLQYMIMGAVTELSKRNRGGALPPIFGVSGTLGLSDVTAYAKIDIRIIDVETTEVVEAFSERGMSKNSSQAFNLYGVSWGETEFGGLEARAIADAALRLGHRIREEMGGEYSYVLSGKGSEFIIDAGNSVGVQDGKDDATLFLVYMDGEDIRGMDNRVMSSEKIPLAVLKVKKAENDFSVCVVAKPTKGSVIKRGDKIEPISTEESKKIRSPKKRPSERTDGRAPAAVPPAPQAPYRAETPQPDLRPTAPSESANISQNEPAVTQPAQPSLSSPSQSDDLDSLINSIVGQWKGSSGEVRWFNSGMTSSSMKKAVMEIKRDSGSASIIMKRRIDYQYGGWSNFDGKTTVKRVSSKKLSWTGQTNSKTRGVKKVIPFEATLELVDSDTLRYREKDAHSDETVIFKRVSQ
jgi:curli biogenesis system outer membrane secretion channel CsgG